MNVLDNFSCNCCVIIIVNIMVHIGHGPTFYYYVLSLFKWMLKTDQYIRSLDLYRFELQHSNAIIFHCLNIYKEKSELGN